MTEITGVVTFPSLGADFYEDLTALHSRPIPESKRLSSKSEKPGHQSVRQPGQTLTVGLVLDDREIAWGDCAGPVYSGIAGRDHLIDPRTAEKTIRDIIAPQLIGKKLNQFKSLSEELDLLEENRVISKELPKHQPGEKLSRRDLFRSASRMVTSSPQIDKETVLKGLRSNVLYGVSQAILAAVGHINNSTLTEVICSEWELPLPDSPVPLHSQSGSDRIQDVDKMIRLGVTSLPHAQIDNIPEQLGKNAIHLIKYARWLAKRIQAHAIKDYHPTIHFDLQGSLGILYDDNLGKILGTITALESAAKPYPLRIESPIIFSTFEEQLQACKELREYIKFRKMNVVLVVNEWANSIGDINLFLDEEAADMIHIHPPVLGALHNTIQGCLDCRSRGIGVLLGGSSAETDLSARISAQIALAVQPNLVLAKPGRCVESSISIVNNQMLRTLQQIEQTNPDHLS